jgi:NAD(P)-dependent dehydrogenase (short-subunit alcohol dehydrogenase family)
MLRDLSTKSFAVSGATSGIGLSTAEILASNNAMVIGIGRSPERCSNTEDFLRRKTGNSRIHFLAADLSSQEAIKNLTDQISQILRRDGEKPLDGLVNNAGVFTYWLTLSPEGIEMQWSVNHLAPFLLTHFLLPLLESSPQGRIVTVSSDSHFYGHINWNDPQLLRHYNGLQAYCNTKLANILFTNELNKRLNRLPNLSAFASDPGLVKTDIGMKGNPAFIGYFWKLRRSGGTEPGIPAQGIAYLLTEPSIQNSPQTYWKDSHPKRSSRASLDMDSAARLWALSERMCGINGKGENEYQ